MYNILPANLPPSLLVGDQLKQKERKMTSITDKDEHTMDMDETLQLPQKHLPIQQQEENENKRRKLAPWFSDLDDDQLMEIFGGGLRFEICRGVLDSELFGGLKLFGTIQVAPVVNFSDPLFWNAFYVFNREFDDAQPISFTDEVQGLDYMSLPVSTSIYLVAAKLYLASDKVDDTVNLGDDYDPKPVTAVDPVDEITAQAFNRWFIEESDYCGSVCVDNEAECIDNGNSEAECIDKKLAEEFYKKQAEDFYNEAFHCCDDFKLIDFSEFSDKPNGGTGSCKLKGKDGSLELYYVAVRYAIDADLEVNFSINSKETKVGGYIYARYGQDYYDKSITPWHVILFETTSASVMPGNINLMRPVLAVPAKSSLIITAELYDSTSSGLILIDGWEFRVPCDLRSSYARLFGRGCSLELKVNWKQPCEELKIPSSNSYFSHLTERRTFGPHATPTTADPDERNRWNLQEEIAKVFYTSLKQTFKIEEVVPCSISTCTKEDGGDYLCSSVLDIWPEIKNPCLYKGPKHAGMAVKDNIMVSDYKDMMGRCVVCGPGFIKFKLCRTWIAKSIHTMLTVGIDTWAPKLSVKKVIISYSLQYRADEMNMGHLQPAFIGETLARVLEYAGVGVVRKRIHDNIDYPDIKDKSFCGSYTRNILDLFWERGLPIGSEGDELPLVYPTDEPYGLHFEEEADLVVNVSDFGPAESVQLNELCRNFGWCPSNSLRFCLVERGAFERFRALSTEVDKLVDLLDEAKSRCKALLAGQGMADEWTAAEREHAAVALEYGALKYAHLKYNRLTTDHTFSFDQMLSEEDNTVVYLHYTHARICSVIRNSNKDVKELTAESLILKHDDERELGLHLLRFTEVLGEVFRFLAPHILCDYLYGLCKKFNGLDSFVSKVVGSSEETSKLLLCKATEVVMGKCFDLLGITPIYKINR